MHRIESCSSEGDRTPAPKLSGDLRARGRLPRPLVVVATSGDGGEYFPLLSLKWKKHLQEIMQGKTQTSNRLESTVTKLMCQPGQLSSLAKLVQIRTCYQQRGPSLQTNIV